MIGVCQLDVEVLLFFSFSWTLVIMSYLIFYFFRYICGLQCVMYVYAVSLFTCDTIFILKKLKHVFLTTLSHNEVAREHNQSSRATFFTR
jgi:hypothetical protein